MSRAVFKTSYQNQPSLFPYSFDSFIDEHHPVRLINQVIDQLDITDILQSYKGGGASSFHPKMLLKVLIYGYLNNIYSSRKIAKALKENVGFMWLSGMQFPDHRTINYFRGKRLKGNIEEIFKQVVLFLQAQGLVTLEEVFTDGTKIEAVSNRYTFVWKKSIEKYKARLEEKIQSVISEINEAIEQDNIAGNKQEKPQHPIADLSTSELNHHIEELNQKLKEQNAPRRLQKKIKKLQKESLPKLMEYETKLSILKERNSYSKTDLEATFMRMKEDHMKNGQLKPAYNLQISTENNFLTNYSVHQNPGDTTTYQIHLESFEKKYNRYPKRAIADAGYGSLENYDFMEEKGIDNYVKYNYFHKEQSKKFKLDISKVENLHYNEKDDFLVCPMGQKMHPVSTRIRESKAGYQYQVVNYKAKNCVGCPVRGTCHKQEGNRTIEINKKLIKHKYKAKENLNSSVGKELRKRRNSEVEQTFGQLKSNKKFNRFLLKGLEKTSIEIGILALAHNFQKLSKFLREKHGKNIDKSLLKTCIRLIHLISNISLRDIIRITEKCNQNSFQFVSLRYPENIKLAA
ncbi:MAG: IS1182 family transposase [Bacteroidales bacterium]|nr:IS1182 family transposase [Bacteroidales bacterium]